MPEGYSSSLRSDLAIIHKHRSASKRNVAEAKYLIGEVKAKKCVLIDDMIDTAGTICAAADLLQENGATEVYGLATHGILSDPALERIEKSAFKKIIVTDTLPVNTKGSKKIEVLSIAPLIAEAIAAVCTGESVSALFEGQNQS
jgi:ribose-phosphate pyrophosphokinase